tara:strand:+ start:235 stop:573 length:339 start_codon:yes stop_codon:yes gene_type:complete
MAYKMKGFSGFGYLMEQAASMSGKKAKKIAEDIKGGMLIDESTEKINKETKQRKIQNANRQSPKTAPKAKPPKRVTEVIEVGPVTSPGVVDGKLLEKQKRKNKNKNKTKKNQ